MRIFAKNKHLILLLFFVKKKLKKSKGSLTLSAPKADISDMTSWLLRTAVTPDTVKIMKIFWHSRVRAWNFLQNGIQNFVFWLIYSWVIALQRQIFDIKKRPKKKALAFKGLKVPDVWLTSGLNCQSFFFRGSIKFLKTWSLNLLSIC